MSMSKRLIFGRNPLDAAARDRLRSQASDYLEEFPHRLAMKRKGGMGTRYWDARWPMSVEQAVRELGFEIVRVNGGMFTREKTERDEICARAEEIWQAMVR